MGDPGFSQRSRPNDTETRLDVTDRDTKWISTRRWWQACSTVLSPAIRLCTSCL
ncbi:hypothetical protein BC835DRAFT_1397757, partial [Cytidiella melzeri]